MKAEVIAIGDELTSGVRLDTNSQWISQRLGDLGIQVLFHTTVADDIEANVTAFRQAIERADVTVCTGGLGPTADDLTRQAIAEAAGVPLVLDEHVLAHIRALFARRKREMPPRNEIQAHFPTGCRPIANPHGSAPGIDMEFPRDGRTAARIFALPGVPAEMREMWQQSVEPAILQLLGTKRRVIRHRSIKCFGVGESDLEQMLPDLIRRGRSPSVGITVSRATITLRVTAEGFTDYECNAAIEPTIVTIRECLGELIFGEEDDELQHVVARLLEKHGRSLSLVEWGSGGLVSQWLSETGISSESFVGAAVVRRRSSLSTLLGLPDDRIGGFDLGGREIVEEMAAAGRRKMASDYALAIGPYPDSDSDAVDPGLLHCALATSQQVESHSTHFAGHPDILPARSGKYALNLLRLALLRAEE